MQRRNYDFEEKTLLGNFDWQKTHFAKHECDVVFLEHESMHNNSRTVTGFDCRIKVPII